MAPTASAALVFQKDEKVLCFHGELLYESKVLDSRLSDPADKKSPLQYRVHYKGWKNTWDDWVPPDRLRRFTEENVELANQLKREVEATKRANAPKKTGRNAGSTGDYNSARPSEERHSSVQAGGSGPRGQKRGRDFEIEKVSPALSSSSAQSTPTCPRPFAWLRHAWPHLDKDLDSEPIPPRPKLWTDRFDPDSCFYKGSRAESSDESDTDEELIRRPKRLRRTDRDLGDVLNKPNSIDRSLTIAGASEAGNMSETAIDSDDGWDQWDESEDTPITQHDSPEEEMVVVESLRALIARLPLSLYYGDSSQTMSEQEESFHSRPSVRLPISDRLKALLVDDWENVTKNLQLVPLPSNTPVNQILDAYFKEEKVKRTEGSADYDLLEEVVQGLREYFEKCLGRILLYRFERQQYFEIRQKLDSGKIPGKTSIGDIYGAEHLCRLFVTMPELIAQTNMDQQSVAKLREELNKLTFWMTRNVDTYLSTQYENASQEYIEKAKGLA